MTGIQAQDFSAFDAQFGGAVPFSNQVLYCPMYKQVLYTVHCIVYSTLMYSLQYLIEISVQCTVYNVLWIMYNAQYALYNVQCTL